MFNNAEWLAPVPLLEFLRDTGKHFTIGYMLQKESVKSRLETGISFTEFAYMLVQAHDYEHLFRTEECELQMGGSDQWGNITAGIELVGRKHGQEVHGLTLPLLTTAAGAKFGKSEGGNVWLDPDKTSPYAFHQFWINQDDRDAERLLLTFSFRAPDEIAELMADHRRAPERRSAQRTLAAEMTAADPRHRGPRAGGVGRRGALQRWRDRPGLAPGHGDAGSRHRQRRLRPGDGDRGRAGAREARVVEGGRAPWHRGARLLPGRRPDHRSRGAAGCGGCWSGWMVRWWRSSGRGRRITSGWL